VAAGLGLGSRICRALNQMEEVSFRIPQEQSSPAAARRLDRYSDGNAKFGQLRLGGLD